ncbi:MAG: serine/threonine-protein kinase [Myxococcota bacterium]
MIDRSDDLPTRLAHAATHGEDTIEAQLQRRELLGRLFGDSVPAPRVGRYEIRSVLGVGGMGTVYAAHDPRLDRTVALKLPHSADGWARGTREAQAMAKIHHPHVVAVYDVGVEQGRPFVAMERVDGETLTAWVRAGQTVAATLEIFRQAGEGLAAAHAHGILHRDFKADNVLVDADGRARVTDFGLARLGGDGDTTQSGTRPGTLLGTWSYMAPEQRAGKVVDVRADIYSYCVVLDEALARATDATSQTRRLSRVRGVLARGHAADPSARWPSMAALLTALQPHRTRRRWGVGAAVAVGSLAWGLVPDGGATTECETGASELDALWNTQRRQAIRDAFLSSGSSHAEATWRLVESRIDRYVVQMRQQWTAACEVAPGRADRLEVDCLAGHTRTLASTLALLSVADARVVDHAVDVASVPTLARCSAALGDHEVGSAAEAALTQARLQSQIGSHGEALAAALAAKDAARRAGERAALAEAQLMAGLAHARLGEVALSEEALREAMLVATEVSHDMVAARAAIELVYVVGYLQARPQQGRIWAGHAEALVERLDEPDRVSARLERHLGILASYAGELDEAGRHYSRALELFQGAAVLDRRGLALAYGNRGSWAFKTGDYEAAHADYARQLQMLREEIGGEHPGAAFAMEDLGDAKARLGMQSEAKRLYDEALQVKLATGAEPRSLASSWTRLGEVALAEQDFETAERYQMRARTTLLAELGADHPKTAWAGVDLGMVYFAQGRMQQARATLELAVDAVVDTVEPDHHWIARARGRLARVEACDGDFASARDNLVEAIRIWRRRMPAEHPDLVEALAMRADLDGGGPGRVFHCDGQ